MSGSHYRADKQIFVNRCHSRDLGSRSWIGHPVHFPRPIYSLSQTSKIYLKRFWCEGQKSWWRQTQRKGTENIRWLNYCSDLSNRRGDNAWTYFNAPSVNIALCMDLMAKGPFTPTRSGSARRVQKCFLRGRVFTLARVHTQFQFTEAQFRSTGSLIYKYWPISAPYSCGSRRRIALWVISAGTHSRPTVEAQQTRDVDSTTQFLQTDPLRSPRAESALVPGSPQVDRIEGLWAFDN